MSEVYRFEHVYYGVSGRPANHLHAVGMCDHTRGLRPATEAQLGLPYCGQCMNKIKSLTERSTRPRIGGASRALVDAEIARRTDMERELVAVNGSMEGAAASLVNSLRFYRGGRGIYFDKESTSSVAEPGVTVGVLHTGEHYDDDLSTSGVIYHYPVTDQPGRDAAEIEATKNAQRLQLPVYVVVEVKDRRDVLKGWVLEWDDSQRAFLIEFAQDLPSSSFAEQDLDDEPFRPTEEKPRTTTQAKTRPGSDKFRFSVLQRSGSLCGACTIADSRLLEAAHVIPYEKGGVDEPRNGLPLCPTHHKAFDKDLLLLDPESLEWRVSEGSSVDLASMQVTRSDLEHLAAVPHPDAVRWRWEARSL